MSLADIAARIAAMESAARSAGLKADQSAVALNKPLEGEAAGAAALERYDRFAKDTESAAEHELAIIMAARRIDENELKAAMIAAGRDRSLLAIVERMDGRIEETMRNHPSPSRPIPEIFTERHPPDGTPARAIEESFYARLASRIAAREAQARIARLVALARTAPHGAPLVRWRTEESNAVERALEDRAADLARRMTRLRDRASRGGGTGVGVLARAKRFIAGALLGASIFGGANQAAAANNMLPSLRQNMTAAVKSVTVEGESCAKWTREALDRGFRIGSDRLAWQYGVTGDAWTMYGNLTAQEPLDRGNIIVYNAFAHHAFSPSLISAVRPFGSRSRDEIPQYAALTAAIEREMPRGLSFAELEGLRSRLRPGMIVGVYNTKSRHQVQAFNETLKWSKENDRPDAVTPTTHVGVVSGTGGAITISHWAGGKVVSESMESMIGGGRYRICWIVDVASQRGMKPILRASNSVQSRR